MVNFVSGFILGAAVAFAFMAWYMASVFDAYHDGDDNQAP